MAKRKLRLIDLFAGAGGLTRGFLDTGRYRVVAAVELDVAAAASYAANFGTRHLYQGDIGAWLDATEAPEAEVVVGGPPCQGFSTLGRQDPDDPRNRLWSLYVECLRRARPKYFVLENVPQFLESEQFQLLMNENKDGGRLMGYRIERGILNAAEFGVPQIRRRAIIIGARTDVSHPGIPHGPLQDPRFWRTVRREIGDLDHKVTTTELPDSKIERFGRVLPGEFKTIDLHVGRKPEPISLARYRSIPEGGNRADLPEKLQAPCWRRHKTGSGDVMGRLRWDKPSVTIRTEFYKPEKGRYLHPTEHRPITLMEAARLQGFPDHHLWVGSKTAIARQIGNAVPVSLARHIANHLTR